MDGPLTLWITYSGAEDPGDPQLTAAELSLVGVEAFYDEIPGVGIWEKVEDPLEHSDLDGWAYLLTPAILRDGARREEMAFALHQARSLLGPDFPLIALLLGLPSDRLPPALRGSAAVSLADPDWKEQVRAAMLGEAPPRTASAVLRRYEVVVHREAGGVATRTAVEFRPRAPELRHWRIGVPTSCQTLVAWGRAPRGGPVIERVDLLDLDRSDVTYGVLRRLGGTRFTFAGCADPVGPEHSAWALFDGRLPRELAFARADFPDGHPVVEAEVFDLSEL